MSNEISLPDLDKLHAEATPGPWRQCGADRGGCPCGWVYSEEFVVLDGADTDSDLPCPPKEQVQANTEWIATIHNAWPTISAKLKELEFEKREALQMYHAARADHGSEALENAVKRLSERNKLLTETLRGILEEKRTQIINLAEGSNGRGPLQVAAYMELMSHIETQVVELESVLGGNQ